MKEIRGYSMAHVPVLKGEEGNSNKLIVTYNIEDASEPTQLFVGADNSGFSASEIYNSIKIDGTEINMSDLTSEELQEIMTAYFYQFTSEGEHIVEYTLKDPTFIGLEMNYQSMTITRLGTVFNTSSITSVEIPNSVTTIGTQAFVMCNGITDIVIPDTVTTIGEVAFMTCKGLVNVTIGTGIISIGAAAFYSCFYILNGTIKATTPPTLGGNPFAGNINTILHVPSESVDIYKTEWPEYADRIQAI